MKKLSKKYKKRERKKKKVKNYEDIKNAERHSSESNSNATKEEKK